MRTTKTVTIRQISSKGGEIERDAIIREIPFTILLNGQEVVTLLCTPQKLEYLAVGFLFSEGILKSRSQI